MRPRRQGLALLCGPSTSPLDCRLETLPGCLTPVYTCAYTALRGWVRVDPAKATANLAKHKVHFADAAVSLEDPRALTMPDPEATGEERFITLAADPTGRVLLTVFTYAGLNIRIISARRASPESRNATRDANAQTVRLFQGKARCSGCTRRRQDAHHYSAR